MTVKQKEEAQGCRKEDEAGCWMQRERRGFAAAQDKGHETAAKENKAGKVEFPRPAGTGPADGVKPGRERQDDERDQGKEDRMPAPVHDDETAKGRTHSRCQGTDQHGGSHHGPDAVKRCLFQDDVEHEGEGNARARILKDPSQEQDGKIRRCCARQRSCKENQIAADKETFQWKAVFQAARCRDDDGQDEQAARGDPLDKGCTDGKLLHQRREDDLHGSFNDDSDERKDAGGEDGKIKPGIGTAFKWLHNGMPPFP